MHTQLQIHPTALIEDGATIGQGTKVWHHSHVRSGASIGAGCRIGKNVFVDAGVSIGDGCKIQNNVSIYAGVTLEDRVFVGPSAVFTNDLFPRADSPSWEVVPTLIRSGSSIGANSTILCGVTVGVRAMVGAGSVVTKSVPDHTLVIGNPARPAGMVCVCGRTVDPHSSVEDCSHLGNDR
jgi:acetyltransferase-like isoleucine patch superfamily enzyme